MRLWGDGPMRAHYHVNYYHAKSADWPDNSPRPLAGMSAADLAQLPEYYVMGTTRTAGESEPGAR